MTRRTAKTFERGEVVDDGSEHPLHRLERAALEYAKAARGSSAADIRAARRVPGKSAREDLLAARARRRKIDASTLLQAAAQMFSAWSAAPPVPSRRIRKRSVK